MSQTPAGVKKLRISMAEKYGSEEGWKQEMRRRGSTGGSAPYKGKKGFAANPELAKRVGVFGGRKSKRTVTNEQ